ncbi:MAG: YbbR-like domain-containing protein [Desulfopila sp.]
MEKLVLTRAKRFFQALFSARKWQRIWSKEWVLKLVSVLIAVCLWFFVGGEDIVDKNVTVPVEIINLPRDLVISNQFKKEIDVTVSGPRSAIEEMINKAVARQIDLTSATPGTKVIENGNTAIPVPRGVTVLRIQPASIILSLDKLIQKQFPVTPMTAGNVANGFEMTDLTMKPDVITITGPQTILSQADELVTDIIDINGLKMSRSSQVPLDLKPAFVDLIGQTLVTAEITIKPKMVEKKIDQVAVDAVLDGAPRKVSPKEVEVVLRVPVLLLRETKDLTQLFSVELEPLVDNNGMVRVSVVANPQNSLPVEVVTVDPVAVQVIDGEKITQPEKAATPEGAREREPNFVEKIENVLNGYGKNEDDDGASTETVPGDNGADSASSEVKIRPIKTKHVNK